jgi:hypothetical protein
MTTKIGYATGAAITQQTTVATINYPPSKEVYLCLEQTIKTNGAPCVVELSRPFEYTLNGEDRSISLQSISFFRVRCSGGGLFTVTSNMRGKKQASCRPAGYNYEWGEEGKRSQINIHDGDCIILQPDSPATFSIEIHSREWKVMPIKEGENQ